MKKFYVLFVLVLGFTALNASAQEPTPTPEMTSLSVGDLTAPTTVRLNSGQNIRYTLYIFLPLQGVSAKDVVLTAKLPSGVNFVSAVPNQGSCNNSDGVITCNLGTITKNYPDYNGFISVIVTPTIAGNLTLTGNIKGSNTLEYSFAQTRIVSPPKSRTRVRFF
jgi:hypothetical protein